jgi:hypothetical protein
MTLHTRGQVKILDALLLGGIALVAGPLFVWGWLLLFGG